MNIISYKMLSTGTFVVLQSSFNDTNENKTFRE